MEPAPQDFALDAVIDKMIAAARSRWPALDCPRDTIVAQLRVFERDPGSEAPAPPSEQDILHPDELYLAAACAQGDAKALAILEREFLAHVRAIVARVDASPDFVDETIQQVRESLLVRRADGRPGKIAQYGGRGPLGGWLRVIAVRQALAQRGRTVLGGGEPADLAGLALPVEDELAKQDSAPVFQEALRAALASLSARERNILRLRFVDNWSPEDIGRSYGVHRGTVARWIASARDQVRDFMAERLSAALGFRRTEFDSVVRLVESRLHVSLSRLE